LKKQGTSVPKPDQERNEFGRASQQLDVENIEATEEPIEGITPEIRMQLRACHGLWIFETIMAHDSPKVELKVQETDNFVAFWRSNKPS